MKNYTFIQHPIEGLHEMIPAWLPGVEKIITIHWNRNGQQSGLLTQRNRQSYKTESLNISGIMPTLSRFLQEKNPFDWYNRQNLPFEVSMKKQNSPDIFTELKNVVLLIRIPETHGSKNSLIFIYLNENPSNFGVTNSINPLTTDNKSIIAFLLRNTIITYIEQQKKNQEVLRFSNDRTKSIIGLANSLKEEMKQTRESYGLSLVKLCQQIIKTISQQLGRNFILTSSAMDKIKNYTGEIKNIELILHDTVGYLQNLYFEGNEDVEIFDWHMQMDDPVLPPSDGYKRDYPKSQDKYAKTISLLNKLEHAALKVKSMNMKMTGTNVGHACPDPISAPAISDALFNHKAKINSLVTMYPDKWETITKEFRPVKNILKRDDDELDENS